MNASTIQQRQTALQMQANSKTMQHSLEKMGKQKIA
jgi:hypothetical protein